MANYWAIAIGINQYQLFQPLSCAQADAEALRDFLVQQAGFSRQRCLLMNETSPPIGDRSTYPTKDNILLLLEDLTAACWQPQDNIWLFFSGYGVNYAGRDYLMPVDADPQNIPETGIEVRSLMQSLQIAQLNVLLLLDINRAVGNGDTPVGQETLELAQELQLATILGCQPEQFSQESRELGHGIFTAALLAALRSGYGISLADLDKHLSIITPELSQHYWRPTQNPVAVIPSTPPTILPPVETTPHTLQFRATIPYSFIPNTLEPSAAEPIIFPEENFAVALAAPPLGGISPNMTYTMSMLREAQNAETAIKDRSQPLPSTDLGFHEHSTAALNSQSIAEEQHFSQSSASMSPDAVMGSRLIPDTPQAYISRLPENRPDASIWRQFIIWGGGTMLVVTLMTIVLLRNQARVLQAREISTTSINQESPAIKTVVRSTAPPQILPLNPPQNRSTAQISVISASRDRNQAVLDLAKKSLRQTQASDLSLAIATAKKIKPGEPLYDQAQENIKIWSRMILDLAEGRAKQRQYNHAIAAAKLIPKEQTLYPQAQTAITQWRTEAKQYLANTTLLDAANALIKPGQASTYNRAIEVAKRVPPGQPGHDLAQASINQWSEKILDLAKSRAEQGDLQAAIATATLVPEVTSVHEDAQEAIQKWRARKPSN